mmetsp:Transcript_13018/g.15882  ORF Transcript_13018/g.15882 Transcript_13018/m.15882 type:complete len:203 (+) Transcript_13018:332-940(+)
MLPPIMIPANQFTTTHDGIVTTGVSNTQAFPNFPTGLHELINNIDPAVWNQLIEWKQLVNKSKLNTKETTRLAAFRIQPTTNHQHSHPVVHLSPKVTFAQSLLIKRIEEARSHLSQIVTLVTIDSVLMVLSHFVTSPLPAKIVLPPPISLLLNLKRIFLPPNDHNVVSGRVNIPKHFHHLPIRYCVLVGFFGDILDSSLPLG